MRIRFLKKALLYLIQNYSFLFLKKEIHTSRSKMRRLYIFGFNVAKCIWWEVLMKGRVNILLHKEIWSICEV